MQSNSIDHSAHLAILRKTTLSPKETERTTNRWRERDLTDRVMLNVIADLGPYMWKRVRSLSLLMPGLFLGLPLRQGAWSWI